MGWTEYLVSVRNKWLRKAAVVQPGFGGGRPVTQVVGHVGNNETDPRLAWQFNLDYPCPEGATGMERNRFASLLLEHKVFWSFGRKREKDRG